MNEQELKKLLDIEKPTESWDAFVNEDVITEAQIGNDVHRPYVLNVDEWDVDHGQKLAEKLGSNELANFGGDLPSTMADFYHAAFHSDPEVVEGCSDQHREEFIKTLLDSPDYHALHQITQWNHAESQIAAKEFAEQFARYAAKQIQQKQQGIRRAKGAEPQAIACMKAVQQAVDKAQKEVDQYQETVKALGAGNEGATNGKTDTQKMMVLYERIKNDGRLRRIMELAGKYRRVAQSKQRLKSVHGFDDMVGVELGGEVARLLPLELAKLADEDFELDAMRRLVERQSMCRQYQGIERKSKGPIVLCVDESGSMSGDKIAEAKAFALAMAWIAMHQHRSATLVAFHHGTHSRIITLLPGKWSEVQLLAWLDGFFGGGTNPNVPLDLVPHVMWPNIRKSPGKADMIVITDGIMTVPYDMEVRFLQWKKKETVSLTTIIIGESKPGDMERVSDEVFLVHDLGIENEAITKCLSI